MSIFELVTLFAAAALAPPPRAHRVDTLQYEMTLSRDQTMHRVVDARLRFRVSPSGRSVIELPHAWAGHSDLEKQVSDLAIVADKSATISDGDSSFAKVISARPGTAVEV